MLVYLILRLFLFFMMRAIGEMFYAYPTQHTFVSFISRYLGANNRTFYWILHSLINCNSSHYRILVIKCIKNQAFIVTVHYLIADL